MGGGITKETRCRSPYSAFPFNSQLVTETGSAMSQSAESAIQDISSMSISG